jgi:mono/diheme cytochrome c family protein
VNEGQAFARAHCAACHAIPPVRISPNPESPAFVDVVAQPALTGETLRAFLKDSHSYPEVMRFEIEPDRIDALAAYMLSLRRPG